MIESNKESFDSAQDRPGRNEPCPCGSGKKYKKCCLQKKEFLETKVDLTTMLRLLYCFVKGLKGQSILITKRTLDTMPSDWQEKLNIQATMVNDLETYRVSIKQEEKSKILIRSKKIILPGEN